MIVDIRLLGWCAATLLAGCGGPTKVEESRQSAYALLDQGQQAFESGNYAKAAEQLGIAVDSGNLNPDAYATAAVRLVVSYAAVGNYEAATSLLRELESGAPNLDEVYAARSYLLRKQGKAAESRAAFAKARQFNRAVKEFKD